MPLSKDSGRSTEAPPKFQSPLFEKAEFVSLPIIPAGQKCVVMEQRLRCQVVWGAVQGLRPHVRVRDGGVLGQIGGGAGSRNIFNGFPHRIGGLARKTHKNISAQFAASEAGVQEVADRSVKVLPGEFPVQIPVQCVIGGLQTKAYGAKTDPPQEAGDFRSNSFYMYRVWCVESHGQVLRRQALQKGNQVIVGCRQQGVVVKGKVLDTIVSMPETDLFHHIRWFTLGEGGV